MSWWHALHLLPLVFRTPHHRWSSRPRCEPVACPSGHLVLFKIHLVFGESVSKCKHFRSQTAGSSAALFKCHYQVVKKRKAAFTNGRVDEWQRLIFLTRNVAHSSRPQGRKSCGKATRCLFAHPLGNTARNVTWHTHCINPFASTRHKRQPKQDSLVGQNHESLAVKQLPPTGNRHSEFSVVMTTGRLSQCCESAVRNAFTSIS